MRTSEPDPALSYLLTATLALIVGIAVGAWAAEHVQDGLLHTLAANCTLAGTLVLDGTELVR